MRNTFTVKYKTKEGPIAFKIRTDLSNAEVPLIAFLSRETQKADMDLSPENFCTYVKSKGFKCKIIKKL